MKIRIAALALALGLTAGASSAFAQTTPTQDPYAWSPMYSIRGSQVAAATATTTVASVTPQVASTPSALENLWAYMPMFRFFNISQ